MDRLQRTWSRRLWAGKQSGLPAPPPLFFVNVVSKRHSRGLTVVNCALDVPRIEARHLGFSLLERKRRATDNSSEKVKARAGLPLCEPGFVEKTFYYRGSFRVTEDFVDVGAALLTTGHFPEGLFGYSTSETLPLTKVTLRSL